MSSITDLLRNVDKMLEKMNIDSTSCVQRVVCDYVKEAAKNTKSGKGSTAEEMISYVTG